LPKVDPPVATEVGAPHGDWRAPIDEAPKAGVLGAPNAGLPKAGVCDGVEEAPKAGFCDGVEDAPNAEGCDGVADAPNGEDVAGF
jgi:hypothetical protein